MISCSCSSNDQYEATDTVNNTPSASYTNCPEKTEHTKSTYPDNEVSLPEDGKFMPKMNIRNPKINNGIIFGNEADVFVLIDSELYKIDNKLKLIEKGGGGLDASDDLIYYSNNNGIYSMKHDGKKDKLIFRAKYPEYLICFDDYIFYITANFNLYEYNIETKEKYLVANGVFPDCSIIIKNMKLYYKKGVGQGEDTICEYDITNKTERTLVNARMNSDDIYCLIENKLYYNVFNKLNDIYVYDLSSNIEEKYTFASNVAILGQFHQYLILDLYDTTEKFIAFDTESKESINIQTFKSIYGTYLFANENEVYFYIVGEDNEDYDYTEDYDYIDTWDHHYIYVLKNNNGEVIFDKLFDKKIKQTGC